MAEWTGFDTQAYEGEQAARMQAIAEAGRAQAQGEEIVQRMLKEKQAAEATEKLTLAIQGIPNLAEIAAQDPAEAMAKISGVMLSQGKVSDATALMKQSADTRKVLADAEKTRFETAEKQAQHIAEAMDIVKADPTPRGWANAMFSLKANFPASDDQENSQLEELTNMEPDDDFDFAGAARVIEHTATTEAYKAELAYKKALTDGQRAQVAESKVRRETLIPAQTELARARITALEKIGGKGTKPTTTDVLKLIQNDYAGEPEEMHLIAMDIADDADRLVAQGIPRAKALESAYKDAKRENKFFALAEKEFAPGSFRNPEELSWDEGGPDPEKMVEGGFYRPSEGALSGYTWQWKGGELVRVEGDEGEDE